MTPTRIRLSRARGFRLPADARSVSRPGPFGNPFTAGDPFPNGIPEGIDPAPSVVQMFREWLEGAPGYERMEPGRRAKLLARLPELRGKHLACWCPLEASACHADVLLELIAKLEESK